MCKPPLISSHPTSSQAKGIILGRLPMDFDLQGCLTASLLLWLTAGLAPALYNLADALLIPGKRELYPSQDWNGEKRAQEQLWQGLGPGEGTEGRSHILVGWRGL